MSELIVFFTRMYRAIDEDFEHPVLSKSKSTLQKISKSNIEFYIVDNGDIVALIIIGEESKYSNKDVDELANIMKNEIKIIANFYDLEVNGLTQNISVFFHPSSNVVSKDNYDKFCTHFNVSNGFKFISKYSLAGGCRWGNAINDFYNSFSDVHLLKNSIGEAQIRNLLELIVENIDLPVIIDKLFELKDTGRVNGLIDKIKSSKLLRKHMITHRGSLISLIDIVQFKKNHFLISEAIESIRSLNNKD